MVKNVQVTNDVQAFSFGTPSEDNTGNGSCDDEPLVSRNSMRMSMRRHTTAVTMGEKDSLSVEGFQGDSQRRYSGSTFSQFEKNARNSGYWDDYDAKVTNKRTPFILPRVADLMPRIKELSKEVSTLKTIEGDLLKDRRDLSRTINTLTLYSQSAFSTLQRNLEREEDHERRVVHWAWQECFSALQYLVVVTEPEESSMSRIPSMSLDRRRVSYPHLEVLRLQDDLDRITEQNGDLTAKANGGIETENKLIAASTRVSELECELHNRDQEIANLRAALEDSQTHLAAQKLRREASATQTQTAATEEPAPTNGVSNGISPPRLEIGAGLRWIKGGSHTPNMYSPQDTRQTSENRSRSAPMTERQTPRQGAPSQLDVSCHSRPVLNGTFHQLDKESFVCGSPVWASGTRRLVTTSGGHWMFVNDSSQIAKSTKPHKGLPPNSPNITWATKCGNEWVVRKLTVTSRKKLLASPRSSPNKPCTAYIRSLRSASQSSERSRSGSRSGTPRRPMAFNSQERFMKNKSGHDMLTGG
eukprot:TRINITY_DN1218_c1_g2_i1.p1 TRINITY_DN1218_c1_g2~~TRINITY_DN1218_c1_g2_i1.p1  ORF type:complete len:572 (+),score=95.41 TRINITY_DN1218_c1_g2_i1:131-1717(+)